MMNPRWLTLFAVLGSVVLSCSDDDAGVSSTGGAGGAGSGAAGQGGRSPNGGTPAQGGSFGGASAGAGGAAIGGGSGGDGTDGGAGDTGGARAQGGNLAGGGAPAEGGKGDGAGGAGGDSAGRGGAAGAGGEAGGSARNTCAFPAPAELGKALLPPGFCAWEWATNVPGPRGITVDPEGNVLVLSRTGSSVLALWDDDGDGVSGPSERAQVATAAALNHTVVLDGGYLYVSRPTIVYRFSYSASRSDIGQPVAVVNQIPGAGHATRSLAFDAQYMYLSVGSGSNLDANSDRARIVRFPLSSLGAAAVPFTAGEVFADGLRNEVGIRFDERGRMWGVENGRDDLMRADLGGDIHADNPGEELNLFAQPGRFYGYPYCWSEFALPTGVGLGAGTQWADPATSGDGTHTDAWCKSTANVVPPVLSMQAHSAPLDILFYQGDAFPGDYRGDAFVTFHGSWDRPEPTGYKVMRVPFGSNGMPSGSPTPLLEYAGTGDVALDWPYRPVGLAVLPNGVLLVTSDTSNTILAIGYRP